MKIKILFILSGNGTGGIMSSFVSLYNVIKDKYDIRVLFTSSNSSTEPLFSECLISDFLLSLYCTPFTLLTLKQKFYSFLLQPIKRYYLLNGVRFPLYLANIITRRLMRKYKFDVVVGFSEGLPTLLASCFDTKSISWIHCDYKRYYEVACRKKDELHLYNCIDTVLCVSKYTQDSFLNIYPSLAIKTRYIYNLLDVDRIREMAKCHVDDNRFKSDLFTIISVGRIDPVKRFSYIPKIAKEIKDYGIPFRWFILGPERNKEELSLLNKRIKDFKVSDRVFWLGGKSNPYPYMAQSDLYVCLSSSEACPMVFNEAKILGVPILTTDFGSAFEFIQDGYDGFITKIEMLSHKLRFLINNSNLLKDISKKASKDSHDNDTIIHQLNQLFQS